MFNFLSSTQGCSSVLFALFSAALLIYSVLLCSVLLCSLPSALCSALFFLLSAACLGTARLVSAPTVLYSGRSDSTVQRDMTFLVLEFYTSYFLFLTFYELAPTRSNLMLWYVANHWSLLYSTAYIINKSGWLFQARCAPWPARCPPGKSWRPASPAAYWPHRQGCGSVSVSGFSRVSGSGSGSRREKMTHKSRKKFNSSCFEVLDGLLRAEGFFCNLDVLYGGIGRGKL